jgi:hypothetical protein
MQYSRSELILKKKRAKRTDILLRGGALTAQEGLDQSQIAYIEAEKLDDLTAGKGTNMCTTYV